MFKCQKFEDDKSDETEPRDLKCKRLDLRDNKKGKGLDKFEDKGEGENIRFIPFLFVVPLYKESNCPTNMCKKRKSLNYFVCISKIG